jgi:hypothetical protein
MNDNSEARNTVWGIIAGLACAALLMFYAVSTGATSGRSRPGTCSFCRPANGTSQNFGGSGSFSNTNK